MAISRRRFFSRSGLLAAGSLAAPQIVRPAEPGNARTGQRPGRIIHLVSDGMSMGTLTCADHLSRLLRQRGLTWMDLYNRPGTVSAMMNVRSLNSLVTDSSASSCAWASGSRIVNGTVNILPDGRVLKTLYELFGDIGWKRGLVTTTEITHATPAGFAASGLKREAAEAIAVQYLDRKIEVLLGGGQKLFDAAQRKDKRDLVPEYTTAGYAVMKSANELNAAPKDKPWLGIFWPSHLPYTIDHIADAKAKETVPPLATMTRRALDKLDRESHFILQVEGGRVDMGGHVCDAASAFRDQIAFDEALDVCLEFQQKHADTLIVLTTDHGTGNPGLNGTGAQYSQSTPLFANLKQVKGSFASIVKRLGGTDYPVELKEPRTPQEIGEAIRDATGYEPPAEKLKLLQTFVEKKGQAIYGSANSFVVQLGQLVANHVGIGWSGSSHTADYVPLLALGPGAERFRGFIQNVDVFKHYTALAGIDFKNPEVPLMAAAGRQEALSDQVHEHWDHEALV